MASSFTSPLALCGYSLSVVFGLVKLLTPVRAVRWFHYLAISTAILTLGAALVLSYIEGSTPAAPPVVANPTPTPSSAPVLATGPTKAVRTSITQTSHGTQSPNIDAPGGTVDIRYDSAPPSGNVHAEGKNQ